LTELPLELVVHGGSVVTMDADRAIVDAGSVAVRDGRIAAVGSRAEIEALGEAEKTLDLSDQVILPGLVNAHTHVLQILLRGGFGGNRALYDWLVNVLAPGLAAYAAADATVAARLYCLEATRSGITTIVDNADVGYDMDLAMATLDALDASGLRVRYARLFYDRMPLEMREVIASLGSEGGGGFEDTEDGEEALASIEELIVRYQGRADGRIDVWPAPAMPQTTSESALAGAFELAEKHDTMVGIHVAQAKFDGRIAGRSAIEHLHHLGALGPRLQAAHCVWLSQSDVELMAETNSKVVHNPASNLYLCAGIAPLTEMLARGVTVGLGTDDSNSNDVINLFQEMKLAVLLQRGKNLEPEGVSPLQALELATLGGARASGLGDEIGSLEPGKRADLIALDLGSARTTPYHDLAATLTLQAGGGEVTATVVGGRVLMEDRRVVGLDQEAELDLLREAQARSAEIGRRAGLRARVLG
jgi:cytosine/adenosine deaminase-related metal-dependent hydrolase